MRTNLPRPPIIVLIVAGVMSLIWAFSYSASLPFEACNDAAIDPYSAWHVIYPLIVGLVSYRWFKHIYFAIIVPLSFEIIWEFIEYQLAPIIPSFACESFHNTMTDILLALVSVGVLAFWIVMQEGKGKDGRRFMNLKKKRRHA
jgi:hypothetical protein